MLLDKAIWDVVGSFFVDEKVRSKLFTALSRAYWPALDEVLMDGNMQRDILYGLDPQTDQRRIEAFTRRWLDDAISRAWASLEQSQEGLSEAVLIDLLKALIIPFGFEDPFSCLPGTLIERLGRPPSDWAFIRIVVRDLFRSWNGGAQANSKKRRKKNNGGASAGGMEAEDGGDDDDAWATRAAPAGAASYGGRKRKNSAAVKKQEAVDFEQEEEDVGEGEGVAEEEEQVEEEEASPGHPECTSADDCIGTPEDRLMRHLHNGKAGDLYCEPCWESFCQRNPSLKGVFADEEP